MFVEYSTGERKAEDKRGMLSEEKGLLVDDVRRGVKRV